MEYPTKNSEFVDLRLPATLLGLFVLFIISLFIAYTQVSMNEFNIGPSLMALFFFIYSIYMSVNSIDRVIFNNSSILLKKKFKGYDLNNISVVSIIKIRFINIVVVRFILEEKKKISGYYFCQKPNHEKFIELLQKWNINYRIKTI